MKDEQKFNAIYHDFKVQVYNLALHYLLNTEDAEEITQDVFVKVYRSLNDFEERSALRTWIYRITVNESLDFIRKKNSKKRLFSFGRNAAPETEYLKLPSYEHPAALLEQKESIAILFEAINKLGDSQKTAFVLSKVEGLPNAEIASIMQTSVSAVESLMFRAKKALREILSEKFDDLRKD